MRIRLAATAFALVLVAACSDPSTVSENGDPRQLGTAIPEGHTQGVQRTWNGASSVRWTRLSLEFFRIRPPGPAPDAGRIGTYMSLAQYRAALAAQDQGAGERQGDRPSLAGAVSGASVVMLKVFYPQHAARIDAELAAQRSDPPGTQASGGDRRRDFDAGEAIGRAIAATVLAQAATDNAGVAPLPPQLTGGWFSNGTPPAKGAIGTRPFFLTTNTEINAPPPPVVGS
jgi:hypothetical protein